MIKAYVSESIVFGERAVILMPCCEREKGFVYEYHLLIPTGDSIWDLVSDVVEFDFREHIENASEANVLDFIVTQLSFVEELCLHKVAEHISARIHELANRYRSLPKNLKIHFSSLTEIHFDGAVTAFKKHLDKNRLNKMVNQTISGDLQQLIGAA
ncbi:MAG: hypothetical protein GC181_13925 [Bacteroidetes bacterium]|nr:hypothetical protein [Bacteroidota bacterium]